MRATSVSLRYARSLAEVAAGRGEETALRIDLELYGRIFEAVPDLSDAFANPAVPREAKSKVLAGLFELYPVSVTAANFLRVLIDHNRIRSYGEIVEAFARLSDERRGVVAARVTAAAPLSAGELGTLRERLGRVTGREVKLEVTADETLLGGLVVQIGSTVYDGSVRRQLDEMKRRLME